MTVLYDWLVLAHVVGVLGFVFSHGLAAAMALRLRHERHPDRIRVLLQVSSSSLAIFYPSTLLLLGAGIWAGFEGGWWDQGWIWVALGLFVANLVFMYAYAAPFYQRVREVMTIQESGSAAVGPEQIDAMLDTNRGRVLLGVGGGSILFVAYLMVLKPF